MALSCIRRTMGSGGGAADTARATSASDVMRTLLPCVTLSSRPSTASMTRPPPNQTASAARDDATQEDFDGPGCSESDVIHAAGQIQRERGQSRTVSPPSLSPLMRSPEDMPRPPIPVAIPPRTGRPETTWRGATRLYQRRWTPRELTVINTLVGVGCRPRALLETSPTIPCPNFPRSLRHECDCHPPGLRLLTLPRSLPRHQIIPPSGRTPEQLAIHTPRSVASPGSTTPPHIDRPRTILDIDVDGAASPRGTPETFSSREKIFVNSCVDTMPSAAGPTSLAQLRYQFETRFVTIVEPPSSPVQIRFLS